MPDGTSAQAFAPGVSGSILFSSNSDAGAVLSFDPSTGKFSQLGQTDLRAAFGLVSDTPTPRVYLGSADYRSGWIASIDAGGIVNNQWAKTPKGTAARALTITPNGRIYAVGGNEDVYQGGLTGFNRSGKELGSWVIKGTEPAFVVHDSQSNVYVPTGKGIARLTPEGTFTYDWAVVGNDFSALLMTPDKQALYAASSSCAVGRSDLQGRVNPEWARIVDGPDTTCYDYAVDGNGNLYTPVSGDHGMNLARISATGEVTANWVPQVCDSTVPDQIGASGDSVYVVCGAREGEGSILNRYQAQQPPS